MRDGVALGNKIQPSEVQVVFIHLKPAIIVASIPTATQRTLSKWPMVASPGLGSPRTNCVYCQVRVEPLPSAPRPFGASVLGDTESRRAPLNCPGNPMPPHKSGTGLNRMPWPSICPTRAPDGLVCHIGLEQHQTTFAPVSRRDECF